MTLMALAMTLTSNVCWFWLCILFALSVGTSQSFSDEDDSCNVFNGQEVKFYSCPKDCSQNDTEYFFNCSIGGLNELTLYNYNLEPLTKAVREFLDPPSLKDIKFKFDVFENEAAGSIYIKFQLPQAKAGVFPDAVQLYFEGISEDDYYTKCVRERIFEFHDYNPHSAREGIVPRKISYTCFYGVGNTPSNQTQERDRYKKGYKLGLKSSPGKWRNYTVTINVLSPHLLTQHWIPTIAVSLNISNMSLLVLVERVPEGIQVSFTNVELYLLPHQSLVKLEVLKNQECKFNGLVHGKYMVKVVIHGQYNGASLSWTGETIEIDATAILKTESRLHHADTMMKPAKILYMGGGCFIGVVLIVLLVMIVHRKRGCKTIIEYTLNPVKGFLLHPLDGVSYSNQTDFVDQYKTILEDTCSCKLSQQRMPEIRQKIQKGTSFSFVLVLYDQSYNKAADLEDVYSHILTEAANQRARDKLRIIPIHFASCPYGSSPDIPPRTSVKWDNLESVYCHIHRVNQPPTSMQYMLRDKWKSTKTGKYLVEKFERVMSQLTTLPCPIERPNNEPVDTMRTSIPDSDAAESMDGNLLEEMKQISMKINLEDDENRCCTREYNRETSVHSITAEVHTDSLDCDRTIDRTVNHMSDQFTNNIGQAMPAHETCHDFGQPWESTPHDQQPKANNTSGLPKDTQIFKSYRKRANSGTIGDGVRLSTNKCVNETNAPSVRQMHLPTNGLHVDNHVNETPNDRHLNDPLTKQAWYQQCSPQAALLYPKNSIPTKIPQPPLQNHNHYSHNHHQNHHHGNHGNHGYTLDKCYENSPLIARHHDDEYYPGGEMLNHHPIFNRNQIKGSPGFQGQPHFGINIPPDGFHSMENAPCNWTMGNRDMYAGELRDHTHHWVPQSHWNGHTDHDHYDEHHIPVEAISERNPLLQLTEPDPEKLQFDAVDPVPPECKSWSRSRSLKGQTGDDSLGYVTRGPGTINCASADDIQSVSQEDVRQPGYSGFDFVGITPPVYDHTSEESLASTEQEEQLKKINENAQANV